jgi:peptidoglycan hydrolase CwlO-like protein
MPNLKKVQKATTEIGAILASIESMEAEREALRKQRDGINEQITVLTQKLGAAKRDLDSSVDALAKGMAE